MARKYHHTWLSQDVKINSSWARVSGKSRWQNPCPAAAWRGAVPFFFFFFFTGIEILPWHMYTVCLRAKRGFSARSVAISKTDMYGRTGICEGVIVRSESETGVTGDTSSRGAYAQAVGEEKINCNTVDAISFT